MMHLLEKKLSDNRSCFVPVQAKKKADVAEHPQGFGHVGLLVNEPLGPAELLFI